MDMPGRPPANTFECVEAIALREPQRLAIVQHERAWSYGDFHLDLVRVTRVLHELGVRRGDRVAVGTSGLQSGLVLLIAAENLGAVTASFLYEDDPDADNLFKIVDWVFSIKPVPVPDGVRNVVIGPEFIERVQRADVSDISTLPRVPLAWDEPQRIARTSGSSGHSKFMLLTRHAQEWFLRSGADNGGYRPESRLLLAGPLVMNVIFVRASVCVRMGATVLSMRPSDLAEVDLTHLLVLPATLEEILRGLPAGYSAPRPIQVQTVGGFVSPQLRERTAKVFGTRITNRYGANEVSGICDDLDAQGTGVVSVGVDVRIVDPSTGSELPPGEMGIVEVRSPAMTDGYIGEPEATKAAFRDGWFHSGDWGTLVAPRVLRLAGRIDDLVNIGGIKVPAAKVEAEVRDIAQAADCAVLAINLDAGQTQIGIALVIDPRASRDELRKRIATELKLGASMRARILFLPQLPRMANGKIDRIGLHRMFASPPEGSL